MSIQHQQSLSALSDLARAAGDSVLALAHIAENKFCAYADFTYDDIKRPTIRLQLTGDGANLIRGTFDQLIEAAENPDNIAATMGMEGAEYDGAPLSLRLENMRKAAEILTQFLGEAQVKIKKIEDAATVIPRKSQSDWDKWDGWKEELDGFNQSTDAALEAFVDHFKRKAYESQGLAKS